MEKVKRSSFIVIAFEDETVFDVNRLLAGEVVLSNSGSKLSAFSGLREDTQTLDPEDLRLIGLTCTSDWLEIGQLHAAAHDSPERVERLLEGGFLISNTRLPELRTRHSRLKGNHWNERAWYFHCTNATSESQKASTSNISDFEQMLLNSRDRAERFIKEFGEPPETYFDPKLSEPFRKVKLPPVSPEDPVFRNLLSRTTQRIFDREAQMTLKDLSALLAYTFGSWGEFRVSQNFTLQHKTSPSGGGLHPIEAYPIILRVESVRPGIYYYGAKDNRLLVVEERPIQNIQEWLRNVGQGQTFIGDAAVVIILVARFARNFWKYRGRSNTYNVIMMDAGHLNQTFSLAASALGLGSFFTAAISPRDILSKLALNRDSFGAIGLCGAGLQSRTELKMPLHENPFFPKE